MTTPISPEVLAVLRALIEDRTGLSYGPSQVGILIDKVVARAHEAGFDSMLDYYYFLRYDDAEGREFTALVDTLVVSETYLFREFDQLRVIANDIMGPLVDQGLRPRLWSAACATGEEPLTLAMLLDARGRLGKVDLVASDVSPRAITRAQRGEHGRRAIRDIPDQALFQAYVRSGDAGPQVEKRLREVIDWRVLNLLDRAAVNELGLFDVIVCRNVLIYFEEKTIQTVIDTLLARLRPGGFLAVGASESLLRFGGALQCEERGGCFLYRKLA